MHMARRKERGHEVLANGDTPKKYSQDEGTELGVHDISASEEACRG